MKKFVRFGILVGIDLVAVSVAWILAVLSVNMPYGVGEVLKENYFFFVGPPFREL